LYKDKQDDLIAEDDEIYEKYYNESEELGIYEKKKYTILK